MSSLWLGYKIGFCKNKQTNKKICAVQQGSKHDNMMKITKHRAEKKKNTLADSNYFYIEESIP